MRHRFRSVSAFIKRRIAVNVVNAVLRENPLSPPVLGLNGNHSAFHLISGQVGDGANHMRQIVKEVRHAAAFVVDDEETDVFRTEIDGEGKNVGLERFRFSGAGRTRDQSVRTVILFVNIQIAGSVAVPETDQRFHGGNAV